MVLEKKVFQLFEKLLPKRFDVIKMDRGAYQTKKQHEMSIYRNHLSKYQEQQKNLLTYQVCELIASSQCREFNFEKLNSRERKRLEKSSREIYTTT